MTKKKSSNNVGEIDYPHYSRQQTLPGYSDKIAND
jgi:hypothetical protein